MTFKKILTILFAWYALCFCMSVVNCVSAENRYIDVPQEPANTISRPSKLTIKPIIPLDDTQNSDISVASFTPETNIAESISIPAPMTNLAIPEIGKLNPDKVQKTLLSFLEKLCTETGIDINVALHCDPHWLRYFYSFESRTPIWIGPNGINAEAELFIDIHDDPANSRMWESFRQ